MLQIWLVGDDLKEEEQLKASKGTLFIPISQLPPRKVRTDCFYHITPAMIVPSSLDNVHSCEVTQFPSFSYSFIFFLVQIYEYLIVILFS